MPFTIHVNLLVFSPNNIVSHSLKIKVYLLLTVPSLYDGQRLMFPLLYYKRHYAGPVFFNRPSVKL